jgi:hypothetical protein
MLNQHPITPPPELRQLWAQQAQRMNPRDPIAWQEHIANQAAQWGANKELEACCGWVDYHCSKDASLDLSADRRPSPPSLKRVALLQLDTLDTLNAALGLEGKGVDLSQIRRALEALND